jgi:hypothetical protein
MFETSDIAIASYVMMKGLRLIKAERERTGRFKFVFDDPDSLGNSYAVEYVNSESAKFDAHMKNLKNVLYKS